MILYLDTSSLIKLYVEEQGSERVRRLVSSAALVSTSIIAYAEARAALARLRRERALTASEHESAKREFDRDWPRFLSVEITEPLARRAGDLAEKHRLRGFDSLHLACYLWLLGPGAPGPIRFSSFDEALNGAARKETRA